MPQDDVPEGNEGPRTCRCDSSPFMTAFLLCVFGKDDVFAMPFIVLLFFTSLVSTACLSNCFPMLDAFCSSEFFRETLDGARCVYLN